jgi:NAD+ diphosphatase
VTESGSRHPTPNETRSVIDLDGDGLPDIFVTVRHHAGVDIPAYGIDDGSLEPPEGFRLDGLRVAFHDLSEPDFRAAGTARQRVEWRRTHRFCSRCGAHNRLDPRQEAMVCVSCGQSHFPRVAPAVIVLVQRGPEALLGRSPHFMPGVYSTLAGFVEAGESLEECVHREIHEEVGVRVTNLRYFGSQPHPFPNSLMIGFVADWLEGEIRIDRDEIEDARWFGADDLPVLPHPMSIARALVDDFVARAGDA